MFSVNQTMKFNHISFPSSDVDATAKFFEQHLGCTISSFGGSRIVKRHDFDIVVDGSGMRAVEWPENFHIGFEVPTAQDVVDLYEQFRAAGAELATGVLRHARGSRFFCVIPGGVQVEINTREDAAEQYRASFGRYQTAEGSDLSENQAAEKS
ncbi:glyoxalase/Bleomycin resistance /Dioxygenase superfamily protein [Collimonas arenae]|uniref:Glyoxalase/Bleomycin resistance /Dioxygenase superfamily protein n=1 Tax=Collimonas arenae TaxID=279058 RepID=A0A127QL84_9BURK|nr:VOC family protein [Collimonas arenae]AMP00918.1 glyoxalase/Bleomycin resistance /Dioxygenase superfamily protein [Collimonas arenae]AMP10811.1 glyoxalase/Bleomycin resistance /Dioxygenase superfamily protein [Collimonas arenae]